MLKVAVAQVGSVLFDTASTLHKVKRLCEEAASGGVRLVVFPEALLGGYPKGLDFGTVVGSRSDAGREMFARYFKAAIPCPGAETEMVAEWARRLGLLIVIGVVERDGGSCIARVCCFRRRVGWLRSIGS
jgi:nitrilase